MATETTALSVEQAISARDHGYRDRLPIMRASFAALARHVRGKRVLDYGCGIGLSAVVQVESGAAHVTGVDLFEERIIEGRPFVASMGLSDRIRLEHAPDTRQLPFAGGAFEVVTCNAMLEHIPQPRDAWIREIWRMVAPGGMLIVNETPNKYLPWDFHTLGLPLTNWLPSPVARWIGVMTGHWRAERTDWDYSGWRGMGYYEFVSNLDGEFTVEHEVTRPRHRVLRALGLPSALLDPYPLYLVRKDRVPV